MPNPELKLFLPVEDAATDQEFQKGPGGEANIALDSDDSYELKFNQNGTIRTLATLTGTQTLTNKTLTSPVIIRTAQSFNQGRAKVGATAGWALPTTTDLWYVATCPASQSGSTLVLFLDNLHIGDTITGFTINAQVESAANTVTIDAALRAVTNVAADPTDAAIGSGMTQVSVTADTAVSQTKTGLTEVVAVGKSYYILITATTGASTDIILQNCQITVTTS